MIIHTKIVNILICIFQIATAIQNSTYLCNLWKNNSIQTQNVENGFTLLILSYRRSLDGRMQVFKNMPFLRKILIIKNSQFPTINDTNKSENLGVPMEIIYSSTNSMNNRYLPYDEIKTDAVLSLDDDFNYLNQEIILGTYFIWRDHPDTIVGLIERSHEHSNGKWRYVTNARPRQKYSLVLAGAMFIHKKYYTTYTYAMNPNIRYLVDTNMNCDDLAINFKVAAMCHQPPWLVVHTNFPKVIFGMQDKGALNLRKNHYKIRENCINSFIKVCFFNSIEFIIKIFIYRYLK